MSSKRIGALGVAKGEYDRCPRTPAFCWPVPQPIPLQILLLLMAPSLTGLNAVFQ